MTSAGRDDIDGRPPADDGAIPPLERAQLVWRRAVALSTSERDDERFGMVLDLLRAAHYGPSTMLHALALGREQQRISPGDVHTRDAMRLLARTTEWLGKPTDQGEVGTADAVSERRTRPR
jgi:hypothetical protein